MLSIRIMYACMYAHYIHVYMHVCILLREKIFKKEIYGFISSMRSRLKRFSFFFFFFSNSSLIGFKFLDPKADTDQCQSHPGFEAMRGSSLDPCSS